jgi:hypothetical protein
MGDFTIAMFADPAGNITGLVNGMGMISRLPSSRVR